MMERSIVAAVVGLGSNGSDTVADVSASEHIARIVGVDTDPGRCRRARERFGIETTVSLDAVLSDPQIALIFISTPNALHYPIGKAALERGKAVCMEKPMGVTRQETEDLLRVVSETRGFLQVGFEARHYCRLYARVKDILDSGEIGLLRHINCQYVLSPFSRDSWYVKAAHSGGLFQEKLCHYIDLPRWWTGSRVERFFCARAANVIPYYEIADNIELTMQFECGVVSHLTFLYGAAGEGANDLIHTEALERQRHEGYRLYYQLVGTEGALEANVFWRELRVFHHAGKPGVDTSRMVRVERWEQKDDLAWFHNTADEKRDVARRVARGLPPATGPEDAAETMRLCFEFEEAAMRPWAVVERAP